MFLKEDSVFRNIEEAIKMFTYAAVLDDKRATIKLGDIYLYGYLGHRSYADAIKYYKFAADKGNVEGYHKLGLCYEKGLGVEQDYAKAFEYYKKAADMNYAKSQCNLGLMYLNGLGVESDEIKSIEYIKKSADQNYGRGYNNLGLAYRDGIGVSYNIDLAEECFKKAINLGYVPAMSNLAYLYRRQEKYIETIELLKKSANLNLMKSCIELGDIYYYGRAGVEQDFQQAFEYYKKASKSDYLFVVDDSNKTANCEDGNEENQFVDFKDGSSYAYFMLGNMYSRGEGEEFDAKMAIENWMQAAERGYTKAILTIAEYYYSIENYSAAFEWYKNALNKGTYVAFNNLLKMYKDGHVKAEKMLEVIKIAEEKEESFEDFSRPSRISRNDYYMSMCRKLGQFYECGYLVEQNSTKATELFQKGDDDIRSSLRKDTLEDFCVAQKFSISRRCLEFDAFYFGIDCKKDYKKSFELCKEYIEKNQRYRHKLGRYYFYGLGTEKDVNKAYEIWQENSNNSESIYFMGKLYEEGVIVEKNIDKALSLFEQAKYHEVLARIELFEIYSEGRYGIKDYVRALSYLDDCDRRPIVRVDNDNGKADYLLGFAYYNGLGTEVNVVEAVWHYIMAAKKGYALADLELGKYCVLKGYKYEAIRHLVTATESGIDGAKELLSTLIL